MKTIHSGTKLRGVDVRGLREWIFDSNSVPFPCRISIPISVRDSTDFHSVIPSNFRIELPLLSQKILHS